MLNNIIATSFFFGIFPSLFIGLQSIAIILFFIISLIKKESLELKKTDLLLFIFFIVVVIKSFFVQDFKTSFFSSLIIPFYMMVLIFYRNFNFSTKKMLSYISNGLFLFSLFSLFHYFIIRKNIMLELGQFSIMIKHSYEEKLFSPMLSVFYHSTGGGIILSILTSMLLLWLTENIKYIKNKTFYLITIMFALITLFFTFARSGYITIFLTLIFIIIKKRKYLLILPLLLLVAIFIFFNPSEKIIKSIKNPLEAHNVEPRMLQREIALKLFKKNPITGIGLMQFKEKYKNSYNEKEYNHFPSYFFEGVDYVHNNYIALLTETGIIGFLIFYIFLIIKLIERIKKYLEESNFCNSFGLFIIIWFLIDSIYNAHLYVAPIGIFLWLGIGLSENKKMRTL